MNKLNYKAGWFLLSCFLFLAACSAPKQNILNKKWYLEAVTVSHKAAPPDSVSSSFSASPNLPVITDTVRTEGSTDFFDFSDEKKYTAQLMGSTTNGNYVFDKIAGRIIRQNETTNITDTIEVRKLSEDTLILFEKENLLSMILVAKK